MKIIQVLSLLAFLVSLLWFVVTPDFEPMIALITSLATLLAATVMHKAKNSESSQTQRVGSQGGAIQVGRDFKIGDVKINSKD